MDILPFNVESHYCQGVAFRILLVPCVNSSGWPWRSDAGAKRFGALTLLQKGPQRHLNFDRRQGMWWFRWPFVWWADDQETRVVLAVNKIVPFKQKVQTLTRVRGYWPQTVLGLEGLLYLNPQFWRVMSCELWTMDEFSRVCLKPQDVGVSGQYRDFTLDGESWRFSFLIFPPRTHCSDLNNCLDDKRPTCNGYSKPKDFQQLFLSTPSMPKYMGRTCFAPRHPTDMGEASRHVDVSQDDNVSHTYSVPLSHIKSSISRKFCKILIFSEFQRLRMLDFPFMRPWVLFPKRHFSGRCFLSSQSPVSCLDQWDAREICPNNMSK